MVIAERSSTWSEKGKDSLRHLSSLGSTFTSQSKDELEAAYQPGYDKFEYECYQRYPDGWPRVAAFMDGCDSFGIFRRFGQCHSRLLLLRMTNIQDIEKQLLDLDKSDEEGDKAWRLKNRYHKEGFDTKKRELEAKLETELLAYVPLLKNYQYLKSLDQAPEKDHDSLFKWIWANKPLDEGEYDWIYHPEDFISIVAPQQNRIEVLIRRHLNARPKTFLKVYFPPVPQSQLKPGYDYHGDRQQGRNYDIKVVKRGCARHHKAFLLF
ncbi:hypothetical protein G7Y89_g15162 [Cudoniella acicularis]|uniref:DUF6594 domain-containing protein n=1 Tax=Cudoniella acicularis TaxID=354080 RepID=A0A8H4VQD4_9HELO|nr:hypothetical protein G7Y89_g15162 [Cudoniella acicularis]